MEAAPRIAQEVANLPPRPEIFVAAQKRGITDVVHFTTNNGVLGVLASGVAKSRKRLPDDEYLEHVYMPNARHRTRDKEWLDYVNLSIQRINDQMFRPSQRWHAHKGVAWVALSFNPEILSHPGVVFTTTNNIYTGCRRAEGLEGFSRMFASRIVRWNGNVVQRRSGTPPDFPTDRQAEVLYPGELSIEYLQRIDVQTEKTLYDIHGMLCGLIMDVPVRHAPEVFR